MPRGSFGKTVARAAASGGSRAYRGKSPRAWYALITLICALGVFLIAYSRNEALHPYHAPAVAPTTSDHWYTALGIDLCGKMQPDLPANTNFSSVGIRTAGDGVILIAPGAVSNSSSYTGKHDTLGTFAVSYPGMTLTSTSLTVPGKPAVHNGEECTASLGPAHGKATLVVETWSSPTAKTGTRYTGDPVNVKLLNGMMVTLGFVPSGTKLPEPPSRAALLGDLNGTAVSAPPAAPTTTTPPTTTGPSTTVAGKSGAAGASSTTVAGKSGAAGASSTTVAGKSGAAGASSTTAVGSGKAGVSSGPAGNPASSSTTLGAAGVASH